MKVALVHDWLIHMRGGEKVLEALAEIYPDATIYTLFCNPEKLSEPLRKMRLKTSFLQHLPGIRTYYRWLLPILPWIIRPLTIERDTQLVISSSHCVAKGIRIPKSAHHVCYCHTPMRYAWGFEDVYFEKFPGWSKPLLHWILARLRDWDKATSKSVHQFIANSENVRARIAEFYGRDATVIYPPTDTVFFRPSGAAKDYYLVVSAFVPYKRVDLVIEAFNKLDRPLRIVGSGPLAESYQTLSRSSQISFLGSPNGYELRTLYAEAKALIFPTDEDFGIVPVEAQACGTPVIAYRKGGALESVQSGVFFDTQIPEAIRAAVLKFESKSFDRNEIAAKVQKFDRKQFKQDVIKFLTFLTVGPGPVRMGPGPVTVVIPE